MSFRLGLPTLWLACSIMLVVNPSEGAAISPTECSQCHNGASHRMFAVKTDSSCAICHAGVKPLHSSIQISQSLVSQETASPAIAKAKLLPKEGSSRVTAEPNPMVLIPAGEFIMGFDGRLPDEGPQHKVNLESYWIDVYEVTNAQYKKFIDATKRRSPAHFVNRTFPGGKADHPVTEVTWYDADAYCAWAGKRLPTDAEWEKAARGTDGRMFPWGNEFDTDKANTPQRWAKLKQEGDTMPVGSFPGGVSPYGLYDMSGNVWEWTSSWYKVYPGNTHASENYGEEYKTLKGGSWWDCTFYKCGISAPVFNRSFFLRGTHNKSFGFRCAKDAAATGKTAASNVTERNP